MTVQPSASRPASKSVGAAVGGILLTLAIFATVMLSFLIVPLVVLLGAYFIYAMLRPRNNKKASEPAAAQPGGQPAPLRPTHGFGTGASS
jgi:uncharacterized membrane protein YfcA